MIRETIEELESLFLNESGDTIEKRAAKAIKSDKTMSKDTTEDVFAYLDALRDSGATNMFGAGPYVESEFGMDRRESKKYVMAWMKTF